MKTILTILLILFLLRLLLKPFIKFTVISTVNKMTDEMRREQERQFKSKPEGTISIDHTKDRTKKGSSGNDGEYIDFEEVK
ncbi:MAG: DUF4834 family protein [Cytophagaceae bacterium]|jgi:hypothetical protein|nr:DUF4834 family protein [Cytophagaceae bacterium]